MGLEGMGSTRRGGSKRVEVFEALVAKRKAGGEPKTLINVANGAATGLGKKSSQDNFRCECEIMVYPRVLEVFEPALRMAIKIKDRSLRPDADHAPAPFCRHSTKHHSVYHVLVPICHHVRDETVPPIQALRDAARDYLLTDALPDGRRRKRVTGEAKRRPI